MKREPKNTTSQSAAGASRRQFLTAGAAALGAATVARAAMAETTEMLLQPISPWTRRSDKRIRMGVVGGGFGLAWHWHEHPNCVVEAVSDLIPKRRDMLAKKYQCAKTYESLEKLVLDPKVDAVAIFTGAPDHARHVLLCMEHGKHVVSACPACMSLEEAAQMKAIKERTGLTYMTAETSAYRWETITARRLHQAGKLGRLVYTEAEYYHPGIGRANDALSMRDGKKTWRYGLPPMLYPTHSTAFLIAVTGERLVKAACIGTGDKNEPALKDNQYGNPFQNGMAMFLTDKGNPFRCNVAWDIEGHGERAEWFGSDGAFYMAGPAKQPCIYRSGGRTYNHAPDYWSMVPEKMRYDSGHGKSHPFLTHEFISALTEEREPVTNLYEALAYCVPGIVAHQSSFKGGEQLDVPSFDPV